MSRVVGDIAVTVGADVSGLETGMKRAGKSVKAFENDASQLAARMAKVTVAVAAVGVAVAAAGIKIASSAANVAKNLENQSRLAGVSAEQFQKLAVAGETVGFSQEKMADIFKDVNDKFGDFMATGAGPLRDFFENIAPQVGVTADQFARLSGPEALQLYVSSLERAGVSQQQMTFYMEALANDATALIPLLANNGSEMKRLGDEAQRAGRIIGNDAVRAGAELDRKLQELTGTLQTNATRAVLEFSDEIIAMAEWVGDVGIPALVALGKGFGEFASAVAPAINAVATFVANMQAATEARNNAAWLAEGWDLSGADQPGSIEQGRKNSIPRLTAGNQAGWFNGEPTTLLRSSDAPSIMPIDALSDDPVEKIRALREAQLEVEKEADERDAARAGSHAKRIEAIESTSWDSRLSKASGVLGDMSALMASENKKIFRIGQAAALAEAIVNGYSAASSAWAKGMAAGGPPLAAAFLAGSVAKTGALIASIASASPSGSGAAGASGAAAAGGATAVPQPVERRVAEFQFTGGNVLDPRAIVDAMNEAYDQGILIKGVLA